MTPPRGRIRKRWVALAVLVSGLALLYAVNASWPAKPQGRLQIIAHRGPHQGFHTEGLTNATCTAARALPITHGYIENTLPSIRAAFAMGADVVEFDVHPTTDGEFAVFHDWTIDCRTEGKGVTRQQSMAYLKTLDVAYGYTADGGRTFPLRGTGKGLMPTFAEVVRAFPGRAFIVNIKSNDPHEADLIDAYLTAHGIDDSRLFFFGGWRPSLRLRELRPTARVGLRSDAQRCMIRYLLLGWSGHMPEACRGGTIAVPLNLRHLFWGWPNRLLARAERAGAAVWVVGPVDLRRRSLTGVDTLEDLRRLPKDWRGGVLTDRIEVVGPALKPQPARSTP